MPIELTGGERVSGFFEPDAYLARVGLRGPVADSESGFEALHRAQVYTIPFENFDIHLGRGIDVASPAIYEKLVRHPRGGYCFELNGLFLQALEHFGFEARALLARVHVSGDPGGRTHQLSLVTLEGREWLADVGFGAATLRAPMPFELDREVEQDGMQFRLVDGKQWGTLLQCEARDGWQNLYSFDLETVCHADVVTANHFTSTHPEVFFTQMRVANLPRPGGRITLADYALTEVNASDVRQSELPEGEDYLSALKMHFGIELDATFDDLKPIHRTKKPGKLRAFAELKPIHRTKKPGKLR